jgi:hypothetical protein
MVPHRLQSMFALVVLDETPRDVGSGTWDCTREILLAMKEKERILHCIEWVSINVTRHCIVLYPVQIAENSTHRDIPVKSNRMANNPLPPPVGQL